MPIERAKAQPPAKLAQNGREAFMNYLDAPPHKAFVMGTDGRFGWASGRRTRDEALSKAMENCPRNADKSCAPVMLDDLPR
jgi:hypothetical protein